jgi:hypothetical protein
LEFQAIGQSLECVTASLFAGTVGFIESTIEVSSYYLIDWVDG